MTVEAVTPTKIIVVSAEVADSEFERFAESWDIDIDEDGLSEEDIDSLHTLKRRLVRAIKAGRLAVNDDGSLTFQLKFSDDVTLTELSLRVPKGNTVVAFDKHKEREGFHKLNVFMAGMAGQPPKLFAQLDHRDLKVPHAVAQLFLGS